MQGFGDNIESGECRKRGIDGASALRSPEFASAKDGSELIV